MPKQRIALIAGIVLALVAIFMVKVYLDQQRQVIQEQAKRTLAKIQANQTAVLVAKKDIPKGIVIEPEMLETAIVPNQYLQPNAVTSLDRVAGMITIGPISKGEQIILSKLSQSRQAGQGGGLAEATPVGKRAITVSVDNVSALGGMIKAGDYVDVIALVPVPVQTQEGKQASQAAVMPLFQNVLVLAVGQETGAVSAQDSRYKKEEKKEISPLITVALSPQEASLIAFVQEQGKIRLILRSPADSQIQPVQPASWDTLFQYLMPQEEVSRKKDEPQAVDYVEIYRGLNKERIPLSR
ncbi:MAG: Flp pilus assembly protein CpaB [Omnitrophica WOR_2 bacterium RIFCSPLOWO2_01_FULL_41_12]|nr:MAG: Flp pilus assembly protein CpaB [Omnitrophica WOR_2 bacterium RIFCSPLOWO2_01_FULL_41_12]